MALTPAHELKAERHKRIAGALEAAKGSITAIAAKHLTPDRMLKVALAAVHRQPKLLECTSASLVQAVVGCAELGLEPNALGHAYLVPYGDQATLIVGYRGLLELAYRSGRILDVTAECAFEGDEFEFRLGSEPFISHVPQGETDAAKVTHAYCIVRFKDGGRVMRVMTRKQLESVRTRSKASKNGPWVSDTVEMYRKTVMRNALKYCPMSVEMVKAESVDLAADAGNQSLADLDWIDTEALDAAPDKGSAALKGKIAVPDLPDGWLGQVWEPATDNGLAALGMGHAEALDWSQNATVAQARTAAAQGTLEEARAALGGGA